MEAKFVFKTRIPSTEREVKRKETSSDYLRLLTARCLGLVIKTVALVTASCFQSLMKNEPFAICVITSRAEHDYRRAERY